jgi:hypothetical protein
MKTRTGKIARLPREVRDELNRRLDNGEDGPSLLAWLNGRPGTLQVMQDHFGGAPVTKQNLSEWRQGGWLDWQRQQEALILADRLLEGAADLEQRAGDGPLTDRMAELLAVALGHLLRDAAHLPAGPEKTRAVLGAAEQLIRLRQTDRDRERATREAREWDRQQRELAEEDRAKAERERKARILAPFHAAQRRRSIATAYGGGEDAEKIAWFTTGVEFDLPECEWAPPPKPDAAPAGAARAPEPVKPSPTESHLVQP